MENKSNISLSGAGKRQSAIDVIDDLINWHRREADNLLSLKKQLEIIELNDGSESALWNLVINKRR